MAQMTEQLGRSFYRNLWAGLSSGAFELFAQDKFNAVCFAPPTLVVNF
jgi:hypothetical protein